MVMWGAGTPTVENLAQGLEEEMELHFEAEWLRRSKFFQSRDFSYSEMVTLPVGWLLSTEFGACEKVKKK